MSTLRDGEALPRSPHRCPEPRSTSACPPARRPKSRSCLKSSPPGRVPSSRLACVDPKTRRHRALLPSLLELQSRQVSQPRAQSLLRLQFPKCWSRANTFAKVELGRGLIWQEAPRAGLDPKFRLLARIHTAWPRRLRGVAQVWQSRRLEVYRSVQTAGVGDSWWSWQRSNMRTAAPCGGHQGALLAIRSSFCFYRNTSPYTEIRQDGKHQHERHQCSR